MCATEFLSDSIRRFLTGESRVEVVLTEFVMFCDKICVGITISAMDLSESISP